MFLEGVVERLNHHIYNLIQSSQINNHTSALVFPFDGYFHGSCDRDRWDEHLPNLRIFFVTEVRMSQQMSGAKVSANCQVGIPFP